MNGWICGWDHTLKNVWQRGEKEKAIRIGEKVFYCVFFLFVFVSWGPHVWHMEVPRLGVCSELQLPSCTTATATPDPYSWARSVWIHILMDTSQVLNPPSTTGTPLSGFKGAFWFQRPFCRFLPPFYQVEKWEPSPAPAAGLTAPIWF